MAGQTEMVRHKWRTVWHRGIATSGMSIGSRVLPVVKRNLWHQRPQLRGLTTSQAVIAKAANCGFISGIDSR